MKLPLTAAALLLTTLTGCATAPTTDRCNSSCSTHEDGYAWAQQGNIEDPAACKGYGAEFTRGCQDAVEDYKQLRPVQKGW